MSAEKALEAMVAGIILVVFGKALAPILSVNVVPLGWLMIVAGVGIAILGPVAILSS